MKVKFSTKTLDSGISVKPSKHNKIAKTTYFNIPNRVEKY